MLVHMDLDIGEKFGRVLHLVDDNRRLVQLQKKLRVILCHIACIEIVQRHIPSSDPFTFRELFEHRRLARLSRPRDEQRRKGLAQIEYLFLHMPCNIRHTRLLFFRQIFVMTQL